MAPTAERFLPVYPGVGSKTVLLAMTGSGFNNNLVMKLLQGMTCFELHSSSQPRYDTHYEACTIHKSCRAGIICFVTSSHEYSSYKLQVIFLMTKS